jgi:hypothetical protein
MEDVCMKKVYHAMLMRGGILIGDVNNYDGAGTQSKQVVADTAGRIT